VPAVIRGKARGSAPARRRPLGSQSEAGLLTAAVGDGGLELVRDGGTVLDRSAEQLTVCKEVAWWLLLEAP
jgi:hypothetical protein